MEDKALGNAFFIYPLSGSELESSCSHLLVEMTIMQRNLEAMSGRIRDLEDALQASHAKTSRGQHPLLTEDLLAIKRAHLDMPGDVDEEEHQEVLDRETMVAFGKLSMSEEATELLGMPLVVRSSSLRIYCKHISSAHQIIPNHRNEATFQ